MAAAVASKPSAPHQKMKRPPLPAVQTNGVHSHQSSPSPSMSTKRPPAGSAFKQPPPAPMANGVNGNVNAMASRLSNRRREPQKPGDVRPNRSGKGLDGQKLPKTIPAPYVKTQPYILKKYRTKAPSLIIHLHPTHFRFDQQDGSFSYSSPMKFILEHLKSQTVPHDMVEELQAAGVRFYEGCLIVQVQDHRSTNSSSNSSSSTITNKNDKKVPFSIHNYTQCVTPSPYAPFPQIDEESKASGNASTAPNADASLSKDKQVNKGPKIFTVVLFPTPLSLQAEVFIQANTPDLRNNRKQSVQVPRTPASATIPPTPMSAIPPTPSANGPPNKKQKMMISGQEIHEFESRAITTTASPLFLDPVDNIEDAHTVLDHLTDPRHKQSHPAPKTRKRTVAELAADEAIAAQEQAFMLIMDERHNVSGPAAKAGTTDGDAGTATFEPRFETWQAIKNIKAEHTERAEREAEAKAHRDAQAAAQKARLEQQAREHRDDAVRRGREAEQQQALEIQRQNHLKEKQMREAAAAHRMQENQMRESQRQALAGSQNQLNHGHPMPHGVSQAQHSSPVVRNMTPNVHSSPSVGNVPMNVTSSGQANASSPARPPSAMQHGHSGPGGVAMGHQRSRQPPSRTTTPLVNGTPAMPHATPVVGHATPRMNQGSPPMAGNPVMNGMPNQGMNGHPQYTPQQMNEIMIRQQHQRRQADLNAQYQRMQNGSPNPQMSPDGRPPMQNLHQLAQQNQHQVRNEYMASLQRQQQAQMQNGNPTHGMPNGGSPAQHLQQPRPPQQNPNQQPQPGQRITPQHHQMQAMIQTFYNKALQNLAARHNGNVAAITSEEQHSARQTAIQRGTSHFKQQQALVRQQQQQIANMQAMGQIPPGMNGQMNGMGAHVGGQQMNDQQRQVMMQMAQMQHRGGGHGVPNVNGNLHAHMNGGGMGGMQ